VFDDRHRLRARALVILGASLFFLFFLASFFSRLHACMQRARTPHFVSPAVPGRELSDMEMHLI